MAIVKINRLLCFSALCSGLLACGAQAREIAMNTAQLQAMDKITGKVSIVEVPVNGHSEYGTFSIVVRSCKTRSPEETPENFAYVDVVDNYQSEKPVNIFRGWMMSSSPALNAVAHPIYDVWLLKCINTDVDKKNLLNDEELRIRNGIARATDDKEIALPQSSQHKTVRQENIAAEENIENAAEASHAVKLGKSDETDRSLEEEAEKAIAEFQQAKNADKLNLEKISVEERPVDEDAPKPLIKINNNEEAEAPKYEDKPVVTPEEDLPSEFIVIKKGNDEAEADSTVDTEITAEQEAMLPELLDNAKPISPEELKDTEIHEEKAIAEEIPLVTSDEIEENGMIEDQLIELDEPEHKLDDIQAESLTE